VVGVPAIHRAVAARRDPLSLVDSVHLYLQGGREVSPGVVRMAAPYCRVDVDLDKASVAAEGQSDGWIALTGDELVIAASPLMGDAHDYGNARALSGVEPSEGGLLESRWVRFAPEAEGRRGVQQGRSIELRFREAPDSLVSALVCFRKGARYPDENDVADVLGQLASVEAPVIGDAAARAQAERDRREAEANAKVVGQAAPDGPVIRSDREHRDRLKEYEEHLAARKPVLLEPTELDAAVADVAGGARRVAAPTPVVKQAVASPTPAGGEEPVRSLGECGSRRDRCRGDCFDRYSRTDAEAFARCRDGCGRAWVKCAGAPR
jgi:hypothetical protein